MGLRNRPVDVEEEEVKPGAGLRGRPADSSAPSEADTSYNLSEDLDPDVEARRHDLANKSGSPLTLVREHEDQIRHQVDAPDFANKTTEAPKTVDYFRLPENAAISKDDFDALVEVERTRNMGLWEKTKLAFEVGRQNIEGSELYSEAGFNVLLDHHDQALTNKIAAFDERRLASPEDRNFFETVVTAAVEQFPLLGEMVKEGVETGLEFTAKMPSPLAAAVGVSVGTTKAIFKLEFGGAFEEIRKFEDENGEIIDQKVAASASAGAATLSTSAEFVGLSLIARTIPGASLVLRKAVLKGVKASLQNPSVRKALLEVAFKYGAAITGEGITEFAQEAFTIMGGEVAKSVAEHKGSGEFEDIDFLGEALPRALESGVEGAAAAIGLGSFGTAYSAATARGRVQRQVQINAVKTANDALETEAFQEEQAAVNEAVNATKTKERSPLKTKEFLDHIGEGEDVYLTPEGYDTLFQSEQGPEVLERLGVDPVAAQEAVDAGQDVKIPLSSVHAFLDPAEFKALAPDLKPAPAAMSAREFEALDLGFEAENLIKLQKEVVAEQKEFSGELGRLREEALAAGNLPDYVEQHSQLLERFANRMAIEGKERVDFLKKVSIRSDQTYVDLQAELNPPPTPGTFTLGQDLEIEQAATTLKDNPQFTEWFGDSKVVDEAGEPLVVYHGSASPAAIEVFDRERINTGAGFWFAPSKQYANVFANKLGRGKGSITPVYLNLRNPIDLSSAEGKRVHKEIGQEAARRRDAGGEYDFAAVAKEKGYDGVTTLGGAEILVFDPTQIKSINNQGTFDPQDPNILRQDQDFYQGLLASVRNNQWGRVEQEVKEAIDSGVSANDILHNTLNPLTAEAADLDKEQRKASGIKMDKLRHIVAEQAGKQTRLSRQVMADTISIDPALPPLTDIAAQIRTPGAAETQWFKADRSTAVEAINETVNDNPGQPRALYRAASKKAKERGAEGVLPHNQEYITVDPSSEAELKGIYWSTSLQGAIQYAKDKYGSAYKDLAEIQAVPVANLPEEVALKNVTAKDNIDSVFVLFPGDVNLDAIEIKDLTEIEDSGTFVIRRNIQDAESQRERDQRADRQRDIGDPGQRGLQSLELRGPEEGPRVSGRYTGPQQADAGGRGPGAVQLGDTVHDMPDGSIMAGPEHAEAVEGSERPATQADVDTTQTPGQDLKGETDPAALEARYPEVSESTVSGLDVLSDVPNRASIPASFNDFTELKGVRELPFSDFGDPQNVFYAADDTQRSRELAGEISTSGEIKPLIIAVDAEGPYILEGAHRFVALSGLGHKTFPAVVVIDEDVRQDPNILFQDASPAINQEDLVAPPIDTPKFKNWFKDSVVTDGRGGPLVVYHGRRGEAFTTFDNSQGDRRSDAPDGTAFFASTKEAALSYAGSEDKILSTYLSIQDPFIVDFKGADWQGDAIGKFGVFSEDTGETELFDSKEEARAFLVEEFGEDIDESTIREDPWIGFSTNSAAEVARSSGHDGLIIENVVDYGSKAEVFEDPLTVYATFEPTQIKSTENVGAFDPQDPNILFQEQSNKLVARHNLSLANLKHADKLGGLAVPSLAITKPDTEFGGFGDITVLAPPELINPRNPSAQVFGADAYSGRYPTVSYKIDDKAFSVLVGRLDRYTDAVVRSRYSDLDFEEVGRRGPESLENSVYFMYDFLKSVGKLPRMKKGGEEHKVLTALRKKISSTKKLQAEYLDYVTDEFNKLSVGERIFTGFTYAGRKKFIPHTLDNVVRLMKKEVRDAEGFDYGVGSIRAKFTPRFRTLGSIKKSGDKLVSTEQFDVLKKEVDSEFFKLVERMRPHVKHDRGDFAIIDDFSAHLKEIADRQSVRKVLDDYYEGYSDEDVEAIAGFLSKLKEFPTEYFEAKIIRSVDLSEFSGAVVPKGKEFDPAIEILKRRGITKIKRYAKNDEAARQEAIQKFDELLFQGKKKEPRGALSFANNEYLISLFARADLSTLLHETAHLFFAEMESLNRSGTASPAFQKDFNSLTTWLGVEEGKPLVTSQREKFARGFEAYLLEGKAPSADLASAFERFKKWLSNVYSSVLDLDIELTDEVRRVFDRLLASEQEVADAATLDDITLLSKEQMDQLGIVPEDREYMARLIKESKDNAEKRMVKDRNRDRKKNMRGWRADAKKEVEAMPVYVALDALIKGEGLDRASLQDGYGPEVIAQIPKNAIKTDGTDLEWAAYAYEFESASDMVNAIAKAPPKQETIDIRVQALSDMHDSQFQPNDYLTDTKEYAEYLFVKAKYMARGGKAADILPRQAFKLHANKILSAMPVKDAQRHDRFLAAMRKYSKIEGQKIRLDKIAEAAEANEKVRLNYEMAGQAVRNRKEVARIIKKAKRSADSKTINPDYRENILAVIERFGLGTERMVPQRPEEKTPLVNLLSDVDGAVDQVAFFSEWILNEAFRKDYKEVSMTDMLELGQLIDYLTGKGRDAHKAMLADGRTTVEEAANLIAAEVSRVPKKKIHDRVSILRKMTSGVRKYFAMMDSFNFIAIALGGYKNIGKKGVKSEAEKLTVDTLVEAQTQKDLMNEKIQTRIEPDLMQLMRTVAKLVKKHGRRMRIDGATVPQLLQEDGQDGWWTPEQVLAIALNMGNEGNVQRLYSGYEGLTPSTVTNLLDLLTKEDWDAIQGLWDTIDSLFKDTDAVNFKLNFFHLNKIEAKPLKTNFGIYKGGYYPARYDGSLLGKEAQRISAFTEKEDLMSRTEAMFQVPATKSGMLKERNDKVMLPLKLSLNVATEHLRDTVQYITHAEAVRDVDRILRHKDVVKPIQEALGREVYDMIRPALKHIARPQRDYPSFIDKTVDTLRGLTTPFILAWNAGVAFKQWFSSPAVMFEIGVKDFFNGYAEAFFRGSPIANFEQMKEMSPYIRQRVHAMDRELQGMFSKMSVTQKTYFFGDKAISWQDVRNFGFWPIRLVDMLAVMPVWKGSYVKAMRDTGGDVEESVKFADGIVRKTQPSAQPLDMSQWQYAGGAVRLFSMFQTFTVGKYGQRQRLHYRAWKSKAISNTDYAWFNFVDAVLPALGMNILFSLLWDKDLGDDDTWKEIGVNILKYWFLTGLPIISDLWSPYGIMESPTKVVMEEMKRTVDTGNDFIENMDQDSMEKVMWQLFRMGSLLSKIPVSRVVDKVIKGSEQGGDNPLRYVVPAPKR